MPTSIIELFSKVNVNQKHLNGIFNEAGISMNSYHVIHNEMKEDEYVLVCMAR